MRDETIIDVYTSGVTGAEYDAGMKQLMSNKEIIIPILQMTVPEFKMCSQEEILQCLDISSKDKCSISETSSGVFPLIRAPRIIPSWRPSCIPFS